MKRAINAAFWAYMWLSQALMPVIVPAGSDFWAAKAHQLIQFGPFDDIPQLMGRGIWFVVPWFFIDRVLRRQQSKKAEAQATSVQ